MHRSQHELVGRVHQCALLRPSRHAVHGLAECCSSPITLGQWPEGTPAVVSPVDRFLLFCLQGIEVWTELPMETVYTYDPLHTGWLACIDTLPWTAQAFVGIIHQTGEPHPPHSSTCTQRRKELMKRTRVNHVHTCGIHAAKLHVHTHATHASQHVWPQLHYPCAHSAALAASSLLAPG